MSALDDTIKWARHQNDMNKLTGSASLGAEHMFDAAVDELASLRANEVLLGIVIAALARWTRALDEHLRLRSAGTKAEFDAAQAQLNEAIDAILEQG